MKELIKIDEWTQLRNVKDMWDWDIINKIASIVSNTPMVSIGSSNPKLSTVILKLSDIEFFFLILIFKLKSILRSVYMLKKI